MHRRHRPVRRRGEDNTSHARETVEITFRRDAFTGEIIAHAPDHPELHGRTLEALWRSGWRARAYGEAGTIKMSRVTPNEEGPLRPEYSPKPGN